MEPAAPARSQENGLIGMCKVEYMYSGKSYTLSLFLSFPFLSNVHGVICISVGTHSHNLKPKPLRRRVL